jgi:hypothetical protein
MSDWESNPSHDHAARYYTQDGYMKRRTKVWISVTGLILVGMVGGRLLFFRWMS